MLGEGQALDVNLRGQVVGGSTHTFTDPFREFTTGTVATLWSGGARTLLGMGDSLARGGNTTANAINDAGDVVLTWAPPHSGSGGRALGRVLLYRGGALREVASGTNAQGTGINQAGRVTGSVGPLVDFKMDAFLWREGSFVYAFPADSLGRIFASSEGEAVNNRGQIVGYGRHRVTGEVRALRADPVE